MYNKFTMKVIDNLWIWYKQLKYYAILQYIIINFLKGTMWTIFIAWFVGDSMSICWGIWLYLLRETWNYQNICYDSHSLSLLVVLLLISFCLDRSLSAQNYADFCGLALMSIYYRKIFYKFHKFFMLLFSIHYIFSSRRL